MMTIFQGTVRHWDADKGRGFITPDAGGDDVFVEFKQLTSGLDYLKVGQRVSYELGLSEGRSQAMQVTVIPE